jgi:hypothetical protein
MKRMKPPKDLGKALKAGYQPMFMTGPEIKENFPPLQGDKRTVRLPPNERANRYDHGERKETDSELWDRKLKESKQTGEERFGEINFAMGIPQQYGISRKSTLGDRAKQSGMPGHISVQVGNAETQGQILGGHHRVALSAEQFKDHIFPVKYFKSLPDAKLDKGYR